jgi:hypothetical protein
MDAQPTQSLAPYDSPKGSLTEFWPQCKTLETGSVASSQSDLNSLLDSIATDDPNYH